MFWMLGINELRETSVCMMDGWGWCPALQMDIKTALSQLYWNKWESFSLCEWVSAVAEVTLEAREGTQLCERDRRGKLGVTNKREIPGNFVPGDFTPIWLFGILGIIWGDLSLWQFSSHQPTTCKDDTKYSGRLDRCQITRYKIAWSLHLFVNLWFLLESASNTPVSFLSPLLVN